MQSPGPRWLPRSQAPVEAQSARSLDGASRQASAGPDPAVLFRQHFPPRPEALSYWGGVPLVPEGFAWPSFTTREGDERALHFVLQVDCAAIPDARSIGLPEQGILYFFVDLHWGRFWESRVLHLEGDLHRFAPAAVPPSLPPAFGDRGVWEWLRSDADWPRVLPRWSFDPVTVRGEDLGPPADEDEVEERRFWPGTIDLPTALARIDGGIVESHHYGHGYNGTGRLRRPYANFPHDWRAVEIAMRALARKAAGDPLKAYVMRGDMTEAERDAYMESLRLEIAYWGTRLDGAIRNAPLDAADSDAVWRALFDLEKVSALGLDGIVEQSIYATIASHPDPWRILPADALALIRCRHALGIRSENRLHINTPDHLLGPPSYVQGEADARLGAWRLLFEMSSDEPISHFFGEGVYQFWIRPEDLAARRFDRVVLAGSAY